MINLTDITWRCNVCGKERPNKYISIHKVDRSSDYDFPTGTVIWNIKYCNDNLECFEGAKKKGENGKW